MLAFKIVALIICCLAFFTHVLMGWGPTELLDEVLIDSPEMEQSARNSHRTTASCFLIAIVAIAFWIAKL